jgi:hypothetical protein
MHSKEGETRRHGDKESQVDNRISLSSLRFSVRLGSADLVHRHQLDRAEVDFFPSLFEWPYV